MTELKTLKDFETTIEFIDTKYKTVSVDELKAEAVKWAKHYQKEYDDSEEWDIKLSLDWIKNFFNLTEEDLA